MPVHIVHASIVRAINDDPDLSYLHHTVEWGSDGQLLRIVESPAYSDADIEEFGAEQVAGWIRDDQRRLETYGTEWYVLGVFAEATIAITLPDEPRGVVAQVKVSSPGSWDVVSDSSQEALEAIEQEETEILRQILWELGVRAPRRPVHTWGRQAKRRGGCDEHERRDRPRDA